MPLFYAICPSAGPDRRPAHVAKLADCTTITVTAAGIRPGKEVTMTDNTTQQANTQPEGNGPAEKMFTQEEVNNIVRERLNRVKAGAAEQDERATALDEREAAVQQREQAMQQKESRVACEDHCKAKGYDTAFLDLLDTSDQIGRAHV